MPLIVVLAANVFDHAGYSYQSGDLGTLKQHIDDGAIGELIISDAVAKACKQQLKESADLLAEDFKKVFDTHQWKLAEGIGCLSDVPAVFDKQNLEEGLLKNFGQYLTDTHAKILTDLTKLKQIPNGYNEIYVVSDDSDGGIVPRGIEKIKIFHTLKELFHAIGSPRGDVVRAMRYFKDTQADLNSYIENILWTKPVIVEGQTWDRHGVCEGEEYDDFEILNIVVHSDVHSIECLNGKAFLSLSVKAEIEVECSYLDEGNSVWDPEEKDYLYKARGDIIENHEIAFPAEVVCEIANKQIKRKTVKPLLQRRLLLDRNTLTDRCNTDASEPGKFYEHLACKCGHYITVNLIDHKEETGTASAGETGNETAHHIACEDRCPNCGRKFRIGGVIYEYPSGSFNYKDINTEWDGENDMEER